jgi:HK97 family phage portal protein
MDWPAFLMGRESKSGQVINYSTALQVTTMLAAVRALAEGVAQTDRMIYRRRADYRGGDPAPDHWAWSLFVDSPNDWQTGYEFAETMVIHLVLCGNFYAFKNVVSGGKVKELIPLEPQRVTVSRAADFSLAYTYTAENGQQQTIPADLIWHVRGPSWNGWMGLEVTKLAREAIGLSLSLEESHALLHKNGIQTTGFYSVDNKLGPEAMKGLAGWIKEVAGGQSKGAPLVLDQGAKWLSQQMTGVDAQHLETRKHQIEEICRAVRLFPQMVGHAGDQSPTFASAEQFFQAYVIHNLGPWYRRIEDSARKHVIADPAIYLVHDKERLMRGSMADQGEYYAKALGAGGGPAWMTQDEVRDELDFNPIGGTAATLREPSNVGPPPKPAA